jgi:hypothetical protein
MEDISGTSFPVVGPDRVYPEKQKNANDNNMPITNCDIRTESFFVERIRPEIEMEPFT